MVASFLLKEIELFSADGWLCAGGTVKGMIDEDLNKDEIVVVLSSP